MVASMIAKTNTAEIMDAMPRSRSDLVFNIGTIRKEFAILEGNVILYGYFRHDGQRALAVYRPHVDRKTSRDSGR
jgi:hypothetical protein